MFRSRTALVTRAQRRGALTVEFAMAVPVLFLIFFGLVEFCRFNMVRHAVDSAAYEGARRGIVPGATADDVRDAAQRILAAVSTIGASVDVDPDTITAETSTVTVSISVPFDLNGWVVPRFLKDRTLERSCTLSREIVD